MKLLHEICSMLCGSLDGRGVWGRMDPCICMTESICCSPEIMTTMLISYTLIQNKKLKIYEDICIKISIVVIPKGWGTMEQEHMKGF